MKTAKSLFKLFTSDIDKSLRYKEDMSDLELTVIKFGLRIGVVILLAVALYVYYYWPVWHLF